MFTLNYSLSKVIKAYEQKYEFVDLEKVNSNSNRFIFAILDILFNEGLIFYYTVKENGTRVYFRFDQAKPFFKRFKFLSKPSLRRYFTKKELLNFYKKNTTLSVLIVSTPRGVVDGKCAVQKNSGGEPLFMLF